MFCIKKRKKKQYFDRLTIKVAFEQCHHLIYSVGGGSSYRELVFHFETIDDDAKLTISVDYSQNYGSN